MKKVRQRKGRGPDPRSDDSRRRRDAPAPDWPVLALAGLGMLITGYLSIVAWSGMAAAFCAPESGCDVVQQSHWSTVLGAPVALWGFGVYALIALCAGLMPPQLRRWRRLWSLSLIGLAISLYLTAVGLIALQAACGWCLASLATIAAIFGTTALRRPAAAPGMPWRDWALRSAVPVLAVVVVLHAYYSGLLQRPENPRLRALAEHLQASGAVYYGASWCAQCQRQARLFGASAERLPYVECMPHGRGGLVAMPCVTAAVQGYPTWIVDGQRYERLLDPDELARLSGFTWDPDSGQDASPGR